MYLNKNDEIEMLDYLLEKIFNVKDVYIILFEGHFFTMI